MKRPCLDCGVLCHATRCDEHRRARENARARNSSTHNGNYAEHRKQRDALALTLPAYCFYGCGKLLTANDPWVAAHLTDGDGDSPRVVSCRSCNERAKIPTTK